VLVAGGLGAVVALAGCGGTGSGSAAAGSPSTASSASSPAGSSSGTASSGTQVTVDASEFTLKLPSDHMAPGTYTFTMDNVGHATHAIAIEGPGVDKARSSTAGPGGTATLTVTLQPGRYEMWCPVGNHKQAGMDTTFTVG
jgi:uncharacterized cupredoxin-like copper-binding protein